MSSLENELESSLLELYEKWKQFMRPKNRFLVMLRPGNPKLYKGPVGTVRYLLTGNASTGFDDLVKAKTTPLASTI